MGAAVEANKAQLRRILKAYAVGDTGPLFAALADDCIWTSNAMPGHYRFGGRREGRAGVTEALAIIATDYNIERYEPAEMIGEGDVVWSTSQVRARDRKNGAALDFTLVSRWEFRHGQLTICQEFFDTASVLCQQGRLPETLPFAKSA